MEEKPVGSSASTGAGAANSPASGEPPSSRRRAGGQKRKANALSTPGSTSAPSKRLTREKAAISHSPIHNGPLTRARQSPGNLVFPDSVAAAGVKVEDKLSLAVEIAAAAAEEERSKLEELEATIEAEFEAIRSRDSNAHIVPSHCGWFSWKKVHLLEERTLPSFFNGKSQTRTPKTYMEIRNSIMKKFHANPNVQIELKDLSELEVADLDARQEVLEFLDYWGLINFHPFPPTDSATNIDSDETSRKDSLLEKLYHFESIQPSPAAFPKPNALSPATPSGLFSDSAIAEELVRPEGPAVEYHCNSCSADCSRKRYHCQKMADYDLCIDCFNNGKFDSNMSSSDFILMEPAEAAGAGGGKWTDQETLLLLEALELYNENWNEIAEHVATKTKAQCILHFVQMPIEDTFFDCDDGIEGNSKETIDPAATVDEGSASKDAYETSEGKGSAKDVPEAGEGKRVAEEDNSLTSPMEVSKAEVTNEVRVIQETTKVDNAKEIGVCQETSKSEDSSDMKAGQEMDKDLALKALSEAFEAVGYPLTPENQLSFAEVGNPVMVLASFLTRLAGPDIATASVRSSLKSLSSSCPNMQLALRHCFILEDPPDDRMERAGFDCVDANMADQDAQKEKGNNSTLASDKRELSTDLNDKKIEDSVPNGKKSLDSANSKPSDKINDGNGGAAVNHEEGEHVNFKESGDSELMKDQPQSSINECDEVPSKLECPSNAVEEPLEGSSAGEQSELAKATKDVDMTSDLKSSEKNKPCPSVATMSVEEQSQTAEASKDVDIGSDSPPLEKNGLQQPVKSNSIGDGSQPTDQSKSTDMLSSVPSESRSEQPITPSVIENGPTTAENQKNSEKEKLNLNEVKDDHNFDKLKCAAVSAISAAAVKAKLLANQEEDQIRQLAASLIEKQLYKMEIKLAFFNEMDNVIMRVREQLERSKQKLYQERAQIIAARLGIPPSSSRAAPPSFAGNRLASIANSIPRPVFNMIAQRPPMARPMVALGPTPPAPSNPLVSTAPAGNPIAPSSQDTISSVGMK